MKKIFSSSQPGLIYQPTASREANQEFDTSQLLLRDLLCRIQIELHASIWHMQGRLSIVLPPRMLRGPDTWFGPFAVITVRHHPPKGEGM